MANSISGNAGVAGAVVAYSGTATGTVTADGSGNYTIPGLAAGTYALSAWQFGSTFSPQSSSQTIVSSNITGVNFTASALVNGLDNSAWSYPEGGFATQIGITGSQIDVNSGGNSLLQLHAVWNPGPTFPGGQGQTPHAWNLSGGMVQWNKMSMLYGTVEAKIKFTGTGSHSTFWLWDLKARQTSYQQSQNSTTGIVVYEIDVAEGVPAIYSNTTTLRQNAGQTVAGLTVDTTTVTDYSANFHVYKCVWTPLSVTYYVDGVQTNQITGAAVPHTPMFMIMDIECGEAGGGAVNQANFPQTYQVDYVKAWDANNNLIFYDEFNGSPALQVFNQSNLPFIQGTAATLASGTSGTLAYASNTTSNSLLLAQGLVASASATITLTDSRGNTWNQIGNSVVSGSTTLAWFYAHNAIGSAANTVTIHSNVSAVLSLVIAEYAGQTQTGNPIDSSATAISSSPFHVTGLPAANFTNEYLAALAWNFDTVTATAADGTVRVTGANGMIEDRPRLNPATYTASWTSGSSGGQGMAIGVNSVNGLPLTFKQGTTAIGSVATTQALAYGSSTTSGSWLLAACLATTSVTDSLGNTWAPIGSSFGGGWTVYQVPANGGSGACTVTAHGPSSQKAMVIAEYTGQAGADPVGTAFAASTWGAAAASVGPVTLKNNDTPVTIAWQNDGVTGTGFDGTVRGGINGFHNGVLEDVTPKPPNAAFWTSGASGTIGALFAIQTAESFSASGGGGLLLGVS